MSNEAQGLPEARLWERGYQLVAGADEVGRGALAGPLVAAAVVLPPFTSVAGLKDSKLLSPGERARLAKEVLTHALGVAIVRVRPGTIDRIGLARANLLALRKALLRLPQRPEYALVDGFPLRRFAVPSLAMPKGDRVSVSVAAASVVAKVYRDRLMHSYHRRFPAYGFSSNVGYATAYHRLALKRQGPCPLHRLSFAGVSGPPEMAQRRETV